MSKSTIALIRNVFKILLSISLGVAGICLIAGCLYIYFLGNGYSRQLVVDVFDKIDIPIYLSLVLLIADIIWEIISPTTSGKSTKLKLDIKNAKTFDGKKSLIIKLVILTIALAIMIFGFIIGGYSDVLTKAINICTECIGLG